MTTQIRLYLELGALVILCAAFALFVHHERAEGAEKIEASDTKATSAAKALADAQTVHEQTLATQAKQAADHEQQAIADYAQSHPIGIVRLCSSNPGNPGVPKGSAKDSGVASTVPGPAAIPAVPTSPDIGPALGELMLDAARLATIDAEWQRR